MAWAAGCFPSYARQSSGDVDAGPSSSQPPLGCLDCERRRHGRAQGKWAEEGLYYFDYEQPSSPWLTVGAVAAAIGVVLLCLFPLAPYKMKARPPSPISLSSCIRLLIHVVVSASSSDD